MTLSLILATICLSTFLQFGNGQPTPTPPVLSESFSTTLTRVGVGQEATSTMYRNYEEGKQRQVEKLGAGKAVDGTINVIVDSKAKKEYEYFEPYGYCSARAAAQVVLQPQWTWTKVAKYKGQKTFNQMNVEVWAYNNTKTNIYYELGVSSETPKVPVFLFEDQAGFAFAVQVFDSYTNGPPEASKFEVPSVCKEQPAWFHHDTRAHNYSSIGAFDNLIG